MTVEKNKFVEIHYTLKDDAGELIDSSTSGEPLGYVHGKNYLLPKLEELIEGKNPGDKFSVVLEPADGYGERNEKLVAKVPRENFDSSVEIEVGMAFQADTPMGPQIVKVIEVSDSEITVDGNHELAGVRLHFDVEVVSVRDATEDELNGGCGGCGGCNGGSCNCEGDCGSGGCGGSGN